MLPDFQFFFGFIVGIPVGAILMLIFLVFSATSMIKKSEQEREHRDPANWWKYGKSPPDYQEDNDNTGGLA
jgi:hypothetical protein